MKRTIDLSPKDINFFENLIPRIKRINTNNSHWLFEVDDISFIQDSQEYFVESSRHRVISFPVDHFDPKILMKDFIKKGYVRFSWTDLGEEVMENHHLKLPIHRAHSLENRTGPVRPFDTEKYHSVGRVIFKNTSTDTEDSTHYDSLGVETKD